MNYALRKPAEQSSLLGVYVASKAVDGNRNPNMLDLSCTHTLNNENPVWWKVDLGKNIMVYAVTMTNRGFAGHRLNDFEIFISPSMYVLEERGPTCDGRRDIPEGSTRTIFCKQPIGGRYLAVVSRKAESLSICELSVQGTEEGMYNTI